MGVERRPRGRALLEEPHELGSRDAEFFSDGSDLEPRRLEVVEGEFEPEPREGDAAIFRLATALRGFG